jgi:anti-sigma B factor antagonist
MSSFNVREQSGALILSFDGAAGLNDFRNSSLRDSLYELIQNRQDPQVALDLGTIDYLSSSGVAILVGVKRRSDTRGGKVVLFHVQPIVQDLLKVMKLDRYFQSAESEAAALSMLRAVPTH